MTSSLANIGSGHARIKNERLQSPFTPWSPARAVFFPIKVRCPIDLICRARVAHSLNAIRQATNKYDFVSLHHANAVEKVWLLWNKGRMPTNLSESARRQQVCYASPTLSPTQVPGIQIWEFCSAYTYRTLPLERRVAAVPTPFYS